MEVDNDIKVIVQYLRADNYQLIATNYYIMTNFGEKHWEYITSYESSREEGVWGDVLNRAVEYQRQYDKFFSDPEAFEQMVSCLEKLYANYLDEYLDDLFGYEHEEEIGYGDSFIRTRYAAGYLEGFEEIEEEITSYEEGFQDRIEELTRYISWDKEERSVWIAAIIILLLLLFVLFKPRFFYIIYRTDTLDDKTLYLFLKKGFYRETKAFSSKFKIAQNMKEKAVYATEKPVSKLSETPAANSQPDDLRKYAELLKDGVITQEEFDAMKQKILEL